MGHAGRAGLVGTGLYRRLRLYRLELVGHPLSGDGFVRRGHQTARSLSRSLTRMRTSRPTRYSGSRPRLSSARTTFSLQPSSCAVSATLKNSRLIALLLTLLPTYKDGQWAVELSRPAHRMVGR